MSTPALTPHAEDTTGGGPDTAAGGGPDTSAPAPASAAPTPAPASARGRRRRRRGPRTWLAALPLLAFTGLCFGLPLGAIAFGAVTRTDPADGATRPTAEHLARSLRGPYLTSLIGSVQLSALTALIATVLGVLIAQAVVTSRSTALRNATLTASGVLANFGGVPLAFAFIATVGISAWSPSSPTSPPSAGTCTPSPASPWSTCTS